MVEYRCAVNFKRNHAHKGKTMKKLCIFLFTILILAGCAQQENVNIKVMRYTTEPLLPTSSCDIFHTKQIGRDYIEIGEVSVVLGKSTQENAVAYLVEKAKGLGANAIILMGERTEGTVVIHMRNMTVANPIKELYAIMIRYK
jgi:hypothetical protein